MVIDHEGEKVHGATFGFSVHVDCDIAAFHPVPAVQVVQSASESFDRSHDDRKRLKVSAKIPSMPSLSQHEAPFFISQAVIFVLTLVFTLTAPASAADKLRIGYGAPSVAMSVLWITKEGKLFEKNNL